VNLDPCGLSKWTVLLIMISKKKKCSLLRSISVGKKNRGRQFFLIVKMIFVGGGGTSGSVGGGDGPNPVLVRDSSTGGD